MNIGIDIDGTLSKTWEKWREVCAQAGLHFTLENTRMVEGKVDGFGEHTYRDVREIIDQRETIDTEYEPYEGAKAILALLEEHDIYIVTARDDFKPGLIDATHLWLEKHDIQHEDIHFGEDKPGAVEKLSLDVIIEDNGHIAQQLADQVPVFLFDQPYNQDFEHENITRFTHWIEVPRLLRTL